MNRSLDAGILGLMGDAAEKLYYEAIKLSPSERREFALRVLASVGADVSKQATQSEGQRAASWETIESLRGAVHLGGNAVDDCDQLYDG